MILSNTALFEALNNGRLVIRPEPKPRTKGLGDDYCPYDTHSVDLSLGSELSVPNDATPFVYNLALPGELATLIAATSTRKLTLKDQPYLLMPNRFILGRTAEWVELPISRDEAVPSLAARIEGKSSRARCGLLVHFTAPTVHPGFRGTLTLEMIDLGPAPFALVPGMPIAQLIVEEVRGIPIENESQFSGQTTPEGRLDKLPDA